MKAFAWTSFCFVEKSPLFLFYKPAQAHGAVVFETVFLSALHNHDSSRFRFMDKINDTGAGCQH